MPRPLRIASPWAREFRYAHELGPDLCPYSSARKRAHTLPLPRVPAIQGSYMLVCYVYVSMCICVCVCMCMCVCLCACVIVCTQSSPARTHTRPLLPGQNTAVSHAYYDCAGGGGGESSALSYCSSRHVWGRARLQARQFRRQRRPPEHRVG